VVHIIGLLSKYSILVFMAIYTIKCFSYFTVKKKSKREDNLNVQVFCIFAVHFLSHVCLYLNTRDRLVIGIYIIELSVAILYLVLFHTAYKEASRLLSNNVVFLLLIGFTMLLRLDSSTVLRQLGLTSLALFITSFLPWFMKKWKHMDRWTAFYGVTGFLFLATVFVPGIGVYMYGARNWISLGPIALQPMEFVKILFVLFVASSLVKLNTLGGLVMNAFSSAGFMMILVAESDFGAVVLFYICYITMVYLATSRPIFMIGGLLLAVGAGALGFLLFKDSLFSHIMVRVDAWRDPHAYATTGGYQILQSLFAIGSGGLEGTGLGNGSPNNIPVVESDFIFSAICEEMGVIFGLAMLLIYVSSFLAMSNVAMKCKKPFFKYMTFGLAVVHICQVFLNIGGVVKFIPSTGVTLPLVSYGFSSICSTLIMFSMVQYTYIHVVKEADDIEKQKEEILERAAGESGAYSVSGVGRG